VRADVRRFVRWLQRAAPPRGTLLRALAAGVVASLVNVALLVGAVALLVESATRPGLRTVLGALIVIELFAFLRSPLRYGERLSAHQLGFAAVSRWRRWLMICVGAFRFTQWRSFAAGDLLERSLRDTDELQELWLRCVIPLTTASVVMALSDLLIGFMAPHGRWWDYAGDLLAIQVLGVAALLANVGALLRRDRVLRRARAQYRTQLVELSAVTPALVLLGRDDFANERAAGTVERLRRAEAAVTRQHELSNAVAPLMTALALGALVVRPHSAALWVVVAALLALATFESLNVVRDAFDTAVHVSAAAERLEELDVALTNGELAWPNDSTIRLEQVRIDEEDVTLVYDATLVVAPGRKVALVGASGVGKSTLLRAIAALDDVAAGVITVGGVSVVDLDEADLRCHVAYVASEPGLTRGYAIDVVRLGRTSSRDVHDDLAALGLITETTTRWEDLSRGERARVAVARAMVTSPSVYLLDEPTSGLGADETTAVLSLLGTTNATVIIATHDPQVMAWCDEVIELDDATLRELRR
jgi:ABC-type transport system involved in cytochrome bd biosynthesis fused ATPase/permease subunit